MPCRISRINSERRHSGAYKLILAGDVTPAYTATGEILVVIAAVRFLSQNAVKHANKEKH